MLLTKCYTICFLETQISQDDSMHRNQLETTAEKLLLLGPEKSEDMVDGKRAPHPAIN